MKIRLYSVLIYINGESGLLSARAGGRSASQVQLTAGAAPREQARTRWKTTLHINPPTPLDSARAPPTLPARSMRQICSDSSGCIRQSFPIKGSVWSKPRWGREAARDVGVCLRVSGVSQDWGGFEALKTQKLSLSLSAIYIRAPFCLGSETLVLFPPPGARVTGSAALINFSHSESRVS